MQCVACAVSDEGSISRFATSIPDLLDKAKLELEKKRLNEIVLVNNIQ